jgi:hypothetical protein
MTMGTDTIEKTPTANAILTEGGELMALAAELVNRSKERMAIKPPCPMSDSVANFAKKAAAHIHKTDVQTCKDHVAIKEIAETQAAILRCVKWTLGLVAATIGTGGMYQVWQWIVAGIKHLPLLFLAVSLAGCMRSTEQLNTVQTVTKVGVESGKPVDYVEKKTIETTSEKQIQADLGPLVKAAVQAATGDLIGTVHGLAGQVTAMGIIPNPKEPVTGNSLIDALLAAMAGYAAIKGTVAGARKLAAPKAK